MAKTALVTGVGRLKGIGAAIARGLAEDGWDLGLSYWDPYDRRSNGQPSDVHLLAEELRNSGRRIVLLPADLSDPTVPEHIMGRVGSEFATRVDALVMSHCESVDSGLLDTTVDSFDRHYAVNVRASWLLIRAFAEQAGPDGGSIIALTSDHTNFNLPYGATKGALDRLVIAATHELADRRIRANVINPGPIDTGWMDDDTRTTLEAMTPGGRLGGPETTAHLVRFLMSDSGAWINGQLLCSNGGFSTPNT